MHAIIYQYPSKHWQVKRLSSSIAHTLGGVLCYRALPDLRRLKKLRPWNLFKRFKTNNSFWLCMYGICSGPSSPEEYLDLWTSIFKHQNWRRNLIPVDLYFQKMKKATHTLEFLTWGKKQLCKKYETYVMELFPTVVWKQGTQNRKSLCMWKLPLPADYQDTQSPNDLCNFSHPYFHALLLKTKHAFSILQRSLLNYKHNKKTRKIAIKRTETGQVLIFYSTEGIESWVYTPGSIQLKATAGSYSVHIHNMLK